MSQTELREWVAGFVDGEGTILANVSTANHNRIGHKARPEVRVGHSYVGGLFDGEGTFGVRIKEHTTDVGYQAMARSAIGMVEHDRLIAILDSYAESIGVEANTYHRERQQEEWKPVFHWVITKLDDVERFCLSIRDYTVVKQPEIDILCREIIPRIRAGKHTNRRGFLEVVAWRDVMSTYKGGLRGKYDLEYFEDLWGMQLEDDSLPDAHPRKRDGSSGGAQ